MPNLFHHTMTVRQFLQLASAIGVLIGAGFVAMPFVPRAAIALQPAVTSSSGSVLGSSTATAEPTFSDSKPEIQNRITIPAIGVDAIIHEGATEATLANGIWRIPTSSTPDHGSNTVLTAHRWQWLTGPNTFYHLDKLAVGDVMTVWWQGEKHLYQVSATFETSSDDMSIEQPTDSAILTLYTCDLWWNSDTRLVVVGKRL